MLSVAQQSPAGSFHEASWFCRSAVVICVALEKMLVVSFMGCCVNS